MLLKIQNIIPPTHLFADNSRWRIQFFVGVDVPSLHKTFDAKQFLWYFIDRKWCTPVHQINGIVRSLLLFYSCSMLVKQSSWFFTWFLRWKCLIIDFQTFFLWVKWLRKEQMPFFTQNRWLRSNQLHNEATTSIEFHT